jgi:hypothetical protein
MVGREAMQSGVESWRAFIERNAPIDGRSSVVNHQYYPSSGSPTPAAKLRETPQVTWVSRITEMGAIDLGYVLAKISRPPSPKWPRYLQDSQVTRMTPLTRMRASDSSILAMMFVPPEDI